MNPAEALHVLKVGVLASHEGTTLQAVLDGCAARTLPCEVVVVISNNRNSGALARARAADVPAVLLNGVTHPQIDALDEAICSVLAQHDVEVVLLAGYLKKLGPVTLARFGGRILNTHPALLPAFGGPGMYGRGLHEAVIASGVRESGASVHLVTEEYDAGPVVAQCRVDVLAGDTPEVLAARVQARERPLVVGVLSAIAEGHLQLPARGQVV